MCELSTPRCDCLSKCFSDCLSKCFSDCLSKGLSPTTLLTPTVGDILPPDDVEGMTRRLSTEDLSPADTCYYSYFYHL